MKKRGTLAAILAITGMMVAAELTAGRTTAVARADEMGGEASGSDSMDSSPSLGEMICTRKRAQATPVAAQSAGKRTPTAQSGPAAEPVSTKAVSTRKSRSATKSDSAAKAGSPEKKSAAKKPAADAPAKTSKKGSVAKTSRKAA